MDEEVEINDVALFRAEIDMQPDFQNANFQLDCELYFSDLSNLGGPTAWKSKWKEYADNIEYKMVQ